MKISLPKIALTKGMFLLLFFIVTSGLSQDYQQITEVPAFKDGKQLNSAWAGGLNAPQICEADLNNDGNKDIFIFDRSSKRSYTFIHVGGANYIFEPSYVLNFPPLDSWVLMADYNCDGVDDIITRGTLASKTYKGFFQNGAIHFEADIDVISYNGSSNIPLNMNIGLESTVLFLKILMETVIGIFLAFDPNSSTRIFYYENLRVESNIPCDSLYFDRIDRCWGNFKETGGIELDLILNDTCDGKFNRLLPPDKDVVLHPGGSVILMFMMKGTMVYTILF